MKDLTLKLIAEAWRWRKGEQVPPNEQARTGIYFKNSCFCFKLLTTTNSRINVFFLIVLEPLSLLAKSFSPQCFEEVFLDYY